MTKILFFILAIAAFLLNSCYYDKESQLYPVAGTSCDTTNITYSVTIKDILQNNSCLNCHSGSAASGGNVMLDNYTSLKQYVQNGQLYGSISHNPAYVPMPQGGNQLSACDIKKIKIWIDSGTPNN